MFRFIRHSLMPDLEEERKRLNLRGNEEEQRKNLEEACDEFNIPREKFYLN